MINVISPNQYETDALDAMARSAVAQTIGVSVGPNGSIIHLPDNSNVATQSIAQQILDNLDDLSVNIDKTIMNEGDADPVITCSDASISGDSDVEYIVLLDDAVYASGSATVTAGVATLNLLSPVEGFYEIVMYRTTGNYASGSVLLTVNEV